MPKLFPEDQAKVDSYLARPQHQVDRKEFRPLRLLLVLLVVLVLITIVSYGIAGLQGLV